MTKPDVERVLAECGVDSKVILNGDDEETDYRTDAASRVRWMHEQYGRLLKVRDELLSGAALVECDCRRPARWGTHPRKDCKSCGGSGYLSRKAKS